MPEENSVFLFSLLSKITELLCGFAPFGKIFGEFYTIQVKFTYFLRDVGVGRTTSEFPSEYTEWWVTMV